LLDRWPDDFWCRVHAGDALPALGDIDGAVSHFAIALQMAEDADDFEARSDAVERLRRLRRHGAASGRGRGMAGDVVAPVPSSRRRQPRRRPTRAQRHRKHRQ
jgi:hypothetical protein